MELLATINSFIFFCISVLHLYWSFGGKRGLTYAIPQKEDGTFLFQPTKVECFGVTIIFLVISLSYLVFIGLIIIPFFSSLSYYFMWVVSGLLLLRAIGDFKCAGFTKKMRNSRFARYDTLFYSPLCLFLALTTAIVAFIG